MNRTSFFKSCFALSIALSAVGCSSSDDGSARAPASSMRTTLGALEAAVETCREQRTSCEANLADATVDKSCVDAFQECKKSALDSAMPDLSKGVKSCSDQARSCRKEAVDDAEKLACQDALKACVSEFSGPKSDEDGGSDEDVGSDEEHKAERDGGKAEHTAPVASCTTALRTCIEGDEEAKVCTDQLRACLEATLPRHANGQENKPDAGKSDEDHGKADEEHGNSQDAGKPEQGDRGQSEEHMPAADAGVADPEKPAKPERDAGRGKPQA